MTTGMAYDPQATYQVRAYDVVYRQDDDGIWQARIYQPAGRGPFPALLDVHGGAWSRGSYTDNERMDQALAASGLLVAAISLRQAPQYPYPSQVIDVNYGVRWLKTHADKFDGDGRVVGALGTSSGGQTLLLSAMRPRDPRYMTHKSYEPEPVEATLAYVIAAWPVLDPYARYLFARDMARVPLVEASESYFVTQEAMQEGNPHLALQRGEALTLPPTLLIQGTADDSVPVAIVPSFADAYGAAGGSIAVEMFANMPHGFARNPGPDTDRALACMKAFIARQLTRPAGAAAR
ncbi:MAG: alpha/beta hydrolase [Candidatus Tectimicrobiota bacterium]